MNSYCRTNFCGENANPHNLEANTNELNHNKNNFLEQYNKIDETNKEINYIKRINIGKYINEDKVKSFQCEQKNDQNYFNKQGNSNSKFDLQKNRIINDTSLIKVNNGKQESLNYFSVNKNYEYNDSLLKLSDGIDVNDLKNSIAKNPKIPPKNVHTKLDKENISEEERKIPISNGTLINIPNQVCRLPVQLNNQAAFEKIIFPSEKLLEKNEKFIENQERVNFSNLNNQNNADKLYHYSIDNICMNSNKNNISLTNNFPSRSFSRDNLFSNNSVLFKDLIQHSDISPLLKINNIHIKSPQRNINEVPFVYKNSLQNNQIQQNTSNINLKEVTNNNLSLNQANKNKRSIFQNHKNNNNNNSNIYFKNKDIRQTYENNIVYSKSKNGPDKIFVCYFFAPENPANHSIRCCNVYDEESILNQQIDQKKCQNNLYLKKNAIPSNDISGKYSVYKDGFVNSYKLNTK